MCRLRLNRLVACCLLLVLAAHYPALADSNRGEPIQLNADHAELDGRTGVGVYTGNVVLTQGSRVLSGERMTVHTRNGRELDHVVVEGQPATWRQSPQPGVAGADVIVGQAPRMEYHARQPERVLLLQGGRIEQGRNTFTGETIEYNLETERITARGRDREERIRITLFPDQSNEQ